MGSALPAGPLCIFPRAAILKYAAHNTPSVCWALPQDDRSNHLGNHFLQLGWSAAVCQLVAKGISMTTPQEVEVQLHFCSFNLIQKQVGIVLTKLIPQTCGTTINCWQVHSQRLLDQTFKLSSLSLSMIWNAHKNSRASPQLPVSISPTSKCHWCYCLKRYHFIMPKYFTVHTKGNKVLTSMG